MIAPEAGKTRKTLMIVEDEALVAITLKDELAAAGYHVLNLTDRLDEATWRSPRRANPISRWSIFGWPDATTASNLPSI